MATSFWQHRITIGLACVALVTIASKGTAQEIQRVPAGAEFRTLGVDTLPEGMFLYQYALNISPTAHPRGVGQIRLDIGTPRTRLAPGLLGVRGRMLFDALRRRFEEADQSHAPLFIGMPSEWYGFIDIEGFLNWRLLGGEGMAIPRIPAGGKVMGFQLRSEGIPMARPWYAEELRLDLQDPELQPNAVPQRGSMTSGYVIGPGWMPDQVTPVLVANQIEVLCQLRLLGDCAPWESARVALSKVTVAGSANWRPAILPLQQLRRLTLERKDISPVAKLVLIKHLSAVIQRFNETINMTLPSPIGAPRP